MWCGTAQQTHVAWQAGYGGTETVQPVGQGAPTVQRGVGVHPLCQGGGWMSAVQCGMWPTQHAAGCDLHGVWHSHSEVGWPCFREWFLYLLFFCGLLGLEIPLCKRMLTRNILNFLRNITHCLLKKCLLIVSIKLIESNWLLNFIGDVP